MNYSELPKEIKLQDDVDSLLATIEELLKKLDKTKEHIQLIQTYTDDERILAQCNLILSMIER